MACLLKLTGVEAEYQGDGCPDERAVPQTRGRPSDGSEEIEVAALEGVEGGLTNLPLHGPEQDWYAIIALACELTAWLQLLTLVSHPARRWEPERPRLRLRLRSVAGRLARSARRTVLHLNNVGRWSDLLLHIVTKLRSLPAPT